MINKNLVLKQGKNCKLSPDAFIGYQEHDGQLILGDNVSIKHGCVIRTCTGIIKIGNNVSIGYYCIIHALGGVTIGHNTMLSPNVQIYAQGHGLNKGKPMREQKQTSKGIKIGNDCWIGAGCVICDGVTIENGAVIGAGAVVVKNVPSYEIHAGNPAKKIGERV